MISENNARKYCYEPSKIENYDKAITDMEHMWECHHRLEIGPNGERISKQDLIQHGLYYNRPSSELIFMTRADHAKLHKSGNSYGGKNKGKPKSGEHRRKLSEALKGKPSPHKGKKLPPKSEETRRKISEARKAYWDRKKMVGE